MTSKLRLILPVVSALVVSTVVSRPASATARSHGAGASRTDAPASVVDWSAHLAPPLRLADVEVVNPTPPAAPAAPAPAPVAAPVVAPVVAPPARREVVHHHEGSYMSTIALNALFGALAGGLVGGALYYLEDNQTHAQRIGYWAAGGVLVGAGVGIVQIMVQENDHTETASLSRLPKDPVPTHRLSLLTAHF